MNDRSYTVKDAKKMFVLVTPRGSFAKSAWGDSWTRNVDDAYILVGEEQAASAAKIINDRLKRKEVTPDPVYKYMKLAWGFSMEKGERVCVEKYFPLIVDVIVGEPFSPEQQKYFYPQNRAYSDAKTAWKHLKNKRISDLEYALQSLKEVNDDLAACEKNLNPEGVPMDNVHPLKRGDE
jgi:hypothetical protein